MKHQKLTSKELMRVNFPQSRDKEADVSSVSPSSEGILKLI